MPIALFDLGRTLVRGDPAVMFARWLRQRERFSDGAWQALEEAVAAYHAGGDPDLAVDRANNAFASAFAGLRGEELQALAEAYVDAGGERDLYAYTRPLLGAIAARGYGRYAVTGVADPLASAIGRALGLDATFATSLATDGEGRLTGATVFDGQPGWKRLRVQHLLEAEGEGLAQALAFGDSGADMPILTAVGRPVVVNARGAFRDEIAALGWPQYGDGDDVAVALEGLWRRPPWNVWFRAEA